MANKNGGRRPVYMPTAEQIADACRIVQLGWSEVTEGTRRQGYQPEPADVTRVHNKPQGRRVFRGGTQD